TVNVTFAVGETVDAANPTTYAYAGPSSAPGPIGPEAQGNSGVIVGGPVSGGTATWWQVAWDDDLIGWVTQGAITDPTPAAPIVRFSANPAVVATGGASSTLTWSSAN